MDYQEYKKEFLTELRNESAISGSDTEDEFIGHSLDILSEFDEIEDPVRIGMGDKKGRGGRLMRIDGYAFDETDHSLILFISDFQDSYSPENLNLSKVDELYWRLYYFLDEACNGSLNDYFDDSDDILKIGQLIKKRINALNEDEERILKIKFFILTNKELGTNLLEANLLETNIRKSKGRSKKAKTTKKIKKQDFNGKPLEINLWHLERFYEMENSNNSEPIVIDIARDFPELNYIGIPCIKGNVGTGLGYDAYIAIIPGKLLSSIYIEHGSKVLEGNVRAFLGTGGSKSVNSGIRRTINTDPTKFFIYNNGISVTAADVEVISVDGELLITKIIDMQIINGGQTTASLAEAVLKKTKTEKQKMMMAYAFMMKWFKQLPNMPTAKIRLPQLTFSLMNLFMSGWKEYQRNILLHPVSIQFLQAGIMSGLESDINKNCLNYAEMKASVFKLNFLKSRLSTRNNLPCTIQRFFIVSHI